jgi:D-sedoheptulose 7-phosphate isomerase
MLSIYKQLWAKSCEFWTDVVNLGQMMWSKEMTLSDYLGESTAVIEAARSAIGQDVMDRAIERICSALKGGKAFLVCGNGGSASDAMHITGELVGRFLKERRPYRAICLSSNPAVITAWANDYAYEEIFSRQVEAYGEPGGVILGISTSGNSKNVVAALEQARRMEMTTIALTGEGGGAMGPAADYLLAAPSRSTPMIQQVHLCLYHYLCAMVECRMMA